MKSIRSYTGVAAAMFAALLINPVSTAAQAPERLTDSDVKKLIEDVDKARDRFEDQLDGKVKDSIRRGPTGELSVRRYLDDFQDNTKKLHDRFTNEYAASQEAQTLLKQASEIDAFMKTQPTDLKGRSEWDCLALDLKRLAGTYTADFPLTATSTVRRINDGEASAAAEETAKLADEFKKAVDKEKTVPKPTKDSLKKDADALNRSAKELKSRLSDSKPATAQAKQVFDGVARLNTVTNGLGLAPATMTALGALRGPLVKLEQAFAVLP